MTEQEIKREIDYIEKSIEIRRSLNLDIWEHHKYLIDLKAMMINTGNVIPFRRKGQ